MSDYIVCGGCNLKVPMHCPSRSCPWAKCPDHGLVALSAEQRRFITGEGEA